MHAGERPQGDEKGRNVEQRDQKTVQRSDGQGREIPGCKRNRGGPVVDREHARDAHEGDGGSA